MKRALAVAASVAAILFVLLQSVTAQTEQVTATVETDPVPAGDDAADDPAIWIHPTDPSLSTIIGTDKTGGGLAVYDLAGNELQYDGSVTPNNVDVRYGFPLGGHTVDLVGFSKVGDGTIGVYTVNPATRRVSNVAAGAIEPSFTPVGFCMYRSPVSDRFYAFAQGSDGEVEQWWLSDDGSGKVGGTLVRSFNVGSNSEGCVADDIYADLYIGEQEVALWKYGAEPGDGDNRTRIDTADGTGTITPDLEGLAIYYTSDGAGYLIASSQGSDEFVIYDRLTGAHVGTFQIVANGVDGVTHTDGIDVTNFPLGSDFPEGVFVAQDDDNPNGNQNFKYVPWGRIARAFGPNLTVDTHFNPRGGSGGGPGTVVEIRIARGAGDAEELRSRRVRLSSSALELVRDRRNQTVGIRFTGVDIPRGATVTDAYIQFTSGEVTTRDASLTIEGHAADRARRFRSKLHDISSRRRTDAALSWTPPGWSIVGAAGVDQRTPDLASILQEIVDRSGWSRGNPIVLIITGRGRRVAESFEGDPAGAPLLHVEYR